MATILQICLLLGVFIPLLSFVFLSFFGTRLGRATAAIDAHHDAHDDHGHHAGPSPGEPRAGWVATAAIAFSFVMAVVVLVIWAGEVAETRLAWSQQSIDAAPLWAMIGSVEVRFGVKLDSLTIIMFLMVTLCATCIHVFSIGYMKGDPRFARFFTFLSLFCFSMLGLVISASLVFMFIFWELVGLCSYFLIGFWFEKKSASNAAIKAFVVNRVGDLGFMVGLAFCFIFLGNLSLDGAPAVFEAGARAAGLAHGPISAAAAAVSPDTVANASKLFTTSFMGVSLATILGVGLFCGAIGKSAQFPLHVWLPDAMEGPTPVSALIHAATMVAAGVYLVARIFLLLTPGAQMFIAVIGCITLTMAALIAIVQMDIKRVLAYSTLSQLGYMIFAMGVGAWIAALFHLLTHAFFKALLFLGSGQVIAGCHHEQDMRRMGGLMSKMPRTGLTFLIAVLAISGTGIPWMGIGIGGYYSKDEILAVAYHRTFSWDSHEAAGEQHADSSGATGSLLPVQGPVAASDEHGRTSRPWHPRNPGGQIMLVAQHDQPGNAHESSQTPTDTHAEPAHTPAMAADHGEGHGDEHGTDYAATYTDTHRLPWVLYFLPILVAYITPFYMGRCFILTFLGKPRDEHIHAHAHESPLMYRPLLVLAAMTLVAGIPFFLFRSFVAYAAPEHSALVPAIDGENHALHAAHTYLPIWVGFAWVVGLGASWLIYRNGFGVAESVRRLPVAKTVHQILWNKFYFDELYGFLFVAGCKLLAGIARLFDSWIIDGIVNNAAYLTERIARFSGVVLDNMGVDGLVNGVASVSFAIGRFLRTVQTGIVRNYIMLAIIGMSGLVFFIVIDFDVVWTLVWVIAAGIALLNPWSGPRRYGTSEHRP